MKFEQAINRVWRWTERYVGKYAFGISPEDLDLILKEVFSFVFIPLLIRTSVLMCRLKSLWLNCVPQEWT